MEQSTLSTTLVGILLSVTLGYNSAVSADNALSAQSSLTLALNSSSNTIWQASAKSAVTINDAANVKTTEAMDKAMEEVSLKLTKQFEDELARKMNYELK